MLIYLVRLGKKLIYMLKAGKGIIFESNKLDMEKICSLAYPLTVTEGCGYIYMHVCSKNVFILNLPLRFQIEYLLPQQSKLLEFNFVMST